MPAWLRSILTRKPRGVPDIDAFWKELSVAYGIDDQYTPEQRYRDFRRVFMADAQGRRVLYQILDWTGLYKAGYSGTDANETPRREGERNIGLQIFAVLNAEPEARQTSTLPEQDRI